MELGILYQAAGDSDSALTSIFLKADSASANINDPVTRAELSIGLAEILLEEGNLEEAYDRTQHVLTTITEQTNQKMFLRATYLQAKYFHTKKDYDRATSLLRKTLASAEATGNVLFQRDASFLLSEIYRLRDDKTRSTEFNNRYRIFAGMLENTDLSRQIERLQFQLELEKMLDLYARRKAQKGLKAAARADRVSRLRERLPVRRDRGSGRSHRQRAQGSRERPADGSHRVRRRRLRQNRSRDARGLRCRSGWQAGGRARADYAACSTAHRQLPRPLRRLAGAHRSRSRASARARKRPRHSEGIEKGSVDIVVATQKLLHAHVRFKDLGLIIVDEEHRFGVRDKERLQALRAEVHVLTLTATPIPRTLNMALGGLRDLSLITTPPAERLAIKTFVTESARAHDS